jgi:putative DNA primase/helicase
VDSRLGGILSRVESSILTESRASLITVLARYGHHPNEDNKYTSPLRPDDRSPGCTIFRGDDQIERFYDWATGDQGIDAFDLIQAREGVTFPEALDISRSLLGLPPISLNGDGPDEDEEPEPVFTVADYSKAKRLPTAWLNDNNVIDNISGGVLFGYCNADGSLHMVRYRETLDAPTKTPHGKKHILYGLQYIQGWLDLGFTHIYLTEGETDTLTMWAHGYPALGIISATGLKLDRDLPYLLNFAHIYLVPDNDNAGRLPARVLADSAIADRVGVLKLPDGVKDVNVFHLLDPTTFKERISDLKIVSVSAFITGDPSRFFVQTRSDRPGSFVPKLAADELRAKHEFAVGEDGGLLRFDRNVWKDDGEPYAESQLSEWLDHLYRPEHVNAAIELLKDRGSFDRISFSPPVEDRVLVHCSNGIVDVLAAAGNSDYRPEPSSPERAWFAAIPHEYVPTATCPKIEEFYRDILPEQADREFAFELLGYGMQFRQTLRRALLIYGSGRNGKSLKLNLDTKLYGPENVTTVSLAKLVGSRFEAANLVGKLANICADIGPNLPSDVSLFKILTGGDRAPGERKFRDSFSFYSGAFPVFSANTWPRTPDTGDAFFDRWLVLPFSQRFPENVKKEAAIRALAEDPDEMRGYFRLAVEALARLTERGDFLVPPSAVAAKRKFIQSTSPIQSWIEERANVDDPEASTNAAEAWQSFQLYCDLNGFRRKKDEGRNVFLDSLAAVEGVGRDGSTFTGISIKALLAP